jgi:hypothetical protein
MTNFMDQIRLLPEKLTVSQLAKKFPSLYETGRMQRTEIRGQPEQAAFSDSLYKTLSVVFTGTDWLAEKLTVSQLARKFPSLYETGRMQRIEIRGQTEQAARSDSLYKTLSIVFTGNEYLTKAWNFIFLACVLR